MGEVIATLSWEGERGRKSVVLLDGVQASPARPSDKTRAKVKMLDRLQIVV
jgi:hypothetical protein